MKEGKTDKVMNMEFGEPFEVVFGSPVVLVEIDLEYLIDQYTYHDAPSSVEFTATKEELQKLVGVLQDRINKMEMLE